MAQNSQDLRLLANRYQLLELVGVGAMGQVYRAEDRLLGGVIVAVKFLSQAQLNLKMKERFEREAKISALLGERSIHIVKVRDYGIDKVDGKEIPFYVMEFLQGRNLRQIIKTEPLSLQRFLSLTKQICFSLETAHKGITFQGELSPVVHRDIKPSNIFVLQDSGICDLVKILDFGIAKLLMTDVEQTQSFLGTLAYCSPEQMEGNELDCRSDIYSLGIIMYEMLTGELPIQPVVSSYGKWYEAHHNLQPNSMSSALNIPQELEQLTLKCLAKSPQERPQNVGELILFLEKLETSLKSQSSFTKQDNLLFLDANQKNKEVAFYDVAVKSVWPRDKPVEKIVFPHLLQTAKKEIASMWVMLEEQDIETRMTSVRYNQFIFLASPHPILLWITLLFHPELGPRWLPCYLDLKSNTGQKIANLLAETGYYWILFFALEQPYKCRQLMSSTIAPSQCQRIKQWALNAQQLKGGNPNLARKILKEELEKTKPRIISKLQSLKPSNSDENFSQ